MKISSVYIQSGNAFRRISAHTVSVLGLSLWIILILFPLSRAANSSAMQLGTWLTKTPMPTARSSVMAEVINGKLYVVGGVRGPHGCCNADVATLEVYDPATDTWISKASMPEPRSAGGAAITDGRLYVVGGYSYSQGRDLATLQVYDPASDSWATKTPMPTARRWLSVEAIDGLIYAIGGTRNDLAQFSTVEVYNPATDTWTTKASMPTARSAMASTVINGKIYVAGGGNSLNGVIGVLEVYDPATDTWTTKSALPTSRIYVSGNNINGKLYAVTGNLDSTFESISTILNVYDPATDTWTSSTPISTGRTRLGEVGVISGKLYAAGGWTASTDNLSVLEVFDPNNVATCVSPLSGLVSWWPGNGNADDIQRGNNGTLRGGVTFAGALIGQAFNLDGTGEVSVSSNASLNVQTFSIDAWVYPTSLDGTVDIIVNKEDQNLVPIQYEIGVRGSDNSNGLGAIPQGNLAVYIGGINGIPNDYASWADGYGAVPLNTWTHVALTFDGSTAKIYANGTLTRTLSGLSGNVNSSSGPFKIGSRSEAIIGGAWPRDRFNGLIDEVELFNRALSTSEIQAIFNAGSSGKCKPPAAIAAPLASFTFNPPSPNVGQVVQFTDTSIGASPLTWSWDFNGDGVSDSNLQNPTRTFNAPGAYPVNLRVRNAYGSNSSTQTVVVASSGTAPVVTGVTRQYPGSILAGTALSNRFDISVDWRGAPGTVRFSVNGGAPIVVNGTANGASHTFNYSTDFSPSYSASTVIITPVNAAGTQGVARTEYVYVFPHPTWLTEAISRNPSSLSPPAISNNGVSYLLAFEYPVPHLGQDENIQLPSVASKLLGAKFGISETFLRVSGSFSSNGTGTLKGFVQGGFEAMDSNTGISTGISVGGGGSGEFLFGPPKGLDITKASAEISVTGTISKEVGIIDAIPSLRSLESKPIIGGTIRKFNEKAKLEGEVSASGQIAFSWAQQNDGKLAFRDGTGTIEVELKGTLRAPIWKKRLEAKGWLAGKGSIEVGVPKPFMREARVGLEAGVLFKADFWKNFCTGATYNVGCTLTPGNGWACAPGGGASDTECPSGDMALSLIKTDYSNFGDYAVFRPTLRAKASSSKVPVSVQETNVISNLHSSASPTLLETGNGKQLLLWAHQDLSLPIPQSTDISWSYKDGSGWSTPALIAHDTRAEFSPVAGVDSSGRVVAAWLRIKDPAFSTSINTLADLPLFYTKLEVVSAVFDPVTKTWGPITQLTDDTAMDANLNLSSDGAGNLLLTWLSNPEGELISTVTSPSILKYSCWKGTNWSTPGAVASGLIGVNDHVVALRGSNAFIILPRDPAPGVEGDAVLDLYTWSGSSWSTASIFAAGGVENRLPSVTYDATGIGHAIWLRGNDLVHATLNSPLPQVIRAGSASMAFYSAQLFTNPQGNLTLVWQEVADNGPANIFAMLYDPATQTWSADRRLSEDTWEAHDIAGFYGNDGRLHLTYLATNILRTTKTVTLDDGVVWTIANIPQDGQTDLRLLEHSLIVDLAVSDTDLAISPRLPRAGEAVTATLNLHNAGDFATGNFAVNLYSGNPNAGGALVGSSTVTGPFRAGDHRALTFSFAYPANGGDIVAVIDANNAVNEFAETNNRASIYLTNTAPQARVLGSVTMGTAPLLVNFDASSSFDNEGDSLSFTWAFADGSASATGAQVAHTFTQTGVYPVAVIVTDARGAVSTGVVTITVGTQFLDVPSTHPFYAQIVKLSAHKITAGCGNGNYCPDASVTREQMAAFIIRALHEPSYLPPTPSSQRFNDVPPSNIFYRHIEEMAVRQITLGCGGGNYCPTGFVTREQMAAFMIRALHEPGYLPPVPAAQRFADVLPSNPFYAHIEEMAMRGITLGCGGGNYCSVANVSRAQMAAFLVRAFGL